MKDTTPEELEMIMEEAWQAFQQYRLMPLKKRADFMRDIARQLEALGDELLELAASESQLPLPRLRAERNRTIWQLNSYAEACEKGNWMDIRIDKGAPNADPPRQDIRKMMVPLGPVVVYGASNFPFAYSTAGGDTACAFAAGCPVIVKAHPAHARTSAMVAEAIRKAAADSYMPRGIFGHILLSDHEAAKSLIQHRYTRAVGFTGSHAGGRQLFDWAAERKDPIPVFAEMGSVNPVFLLPGKMKQDADKVARMYAASILQSVGQFCTNPGLIFAIDNQDLSRFMEVLGEEIRQTEPGEMLHAGIFKSYVEKRANALAQEQVELVAVSEKEARFNQAVPTIASATAQAFLKNPILHQEVFGPYSLIIKCKDQEEMLQLATILEGQLTCNIIGTEEDVQQHRELVETLKFTCGRFVFNGVPTGVEVVLSMHHGGPYPATTDSRFTSVGADGIRRFARPLAYQNWPDELLPDELKNSNPLGCWRTVNNELTRQPL